MKRVALAALIGLSVGCARKPSDEDAPLTALPQFHPPTEPGPATVPDEFRYPKRVSDGGEAPAAKGDGG